MNSAVTLLAVLASWGVCGCGRSVAQIDMKPYVSDGGGHNWLFVRDQRRHVDFGANDAHLISGWLITHEDGWKSASLDDFTPSTRQLLTAHCVIGIDGDRILLSYEKDQRNPDSTIYIQRPLSADEQAFWNQLIARVDSPNHALESTATRR